MTLLVLLLLCLPFVAHMSSSAYSSSSHGSESNHNHRHTLSSPGTTTTASISLSYMVSKSEILVTLSARDAQFPSQIVVSMSAYYNNASTPYSVQSVTLSTNGAGSFSYTFKVMFSGNGNYLFVGGICSTSGSLIAQTSIDPRVDPDW
jgi:hypothetical protein